MRTIYLSAGHSTQPGKDRGAAGNGYIEGVAAASLRALIARKLANIHGITAIVDDDKNVLSDTLRYFKNLTTTDSIVVDIHFNAGPVTATGTEVLIPSPASVFETALAAELSLIMADVLGIRNRGVKNELQSHHGRLGWMRLTGENILLEVCFISNASDMHHYIENETTLATAIAGVLAKYAKK